MYKRQSFDSGPHKGQLRNFLGPVFAPPQSKGQSYLELNTTNQLENPVKIWEYLVGQGRVRRAPELQYDTPETQANDLINYDESYGWYGSQDRYDWKCLGKKEMYIPYNNNKLWNATPQEDVYKRQVESVTSVAARSKNRPGTCRKRLKNGANARMTASAIGASDRWTSASGY